MCGIVGFSWDDPALLRKMMDSVAHRGPNGSGSYRDKGISLGHRRLSIIDLSARGKQPLANERRNIFAVVNGEIYNYKKLREELLRRGHRFFGESDSEVIVHGYEEYGERLLERLEGMFAFAVWDARRKRIFLARDRIGERPLYYFYDGKDIIFASEIKAILVHGMKRDIDFQTVSDYMTLRAASGNRTIIKNIFKLLPGEMIVHEKGKIKAGKYWDLPEFSLNSNYSPDYLSGLIYESIKERLMADVPIGVFLSGGLDSSTLVAYMSKMHEKIKTFSLGFNDATDEVKYAKIIADKFGTEHTEIISDRDSLRLLPKIIWHLDELMADPAAIPTYIISEETSKKVRVVLAGEGGDEVFGGYHPPNYASRIGKAHGFPRMFKKIAGSLLGQGSIFFRYPKKQILMLAKDMLYSEDLKKSYRKMFYFPFEDEKKKLFGASFGDSELRTAWDFIVDEKNLENSTFRYYFKEFLPNDLLLKADRMGLANGLEIRVPYLDVGLVEHSFGLAPKMKHNRELFRRVIREMLPREILEKKKQGFTMPISRWFGSKDFMSRLKVHFEDLKRRNIFNNEEYMKIVSQPGKFKNDHRLWVLLNFEIWNKVFIDGIDYSRISV